MIQSFGDRATEDLYHDRKTARVRGLPADVAKRAVRKLDMIRAAAELEDLRVLPGNRLEALRGDREGHHSIRVNEQWRIVFGWRDGHARDVELTDYR